MRLIVLIIVIMAAICGTICCRMLAVWEMEARRADVSMGVGCSGGDDGAGDGDEADELTVDAAGLAGEDGSGGKCAADCSGRDADGDDGAAAAAAGGPAATTELHEPPRMEALMYSGRGLGGLQPVGFCSGAQCERYRAQVKEEWPSWLHSLQCRCSGSTWQTCCASAL